MIKKELKFANLNFTMQVRHVFQVLCGVISEFYVLFPGSMLNHRPVWVCATKIVQDLGRRTLDKRVDACPFFSFLFFFCLFYNGR